MGNCELIAEKNPLRASIVPFDISGLRCPSLMTLFQHATSYVRNIQIERVTNGKRSGGQEEHPAVTLGLAVQRPTIRFADWLDRGQQIEAIAHELVHILLIYRHGLRMIDRRIHHLGTDQDLVDYFLDINRFWNYLLEQTVNTIHHRILVDYLKVEYGIESDFYLALLDHNFRAVCGMNYPDRESQYAKGLIAFEYEERRGRVDRAIFSLTQSDFFWKAYVSAQKYFGGYGFHSIPISATYQEHILSFLEDLGYQTRDFRFVPIKGFDSYSPQER